MKGFEARELLPGFVLREVSPETFRQFFDTLLPRAFPNRQRPDLNLILSQAEREAEAALSPPIPPEYRSPPLRLAIYKNDDVVGWHLGGKKDFDEFYMRNSAVLPEFQGMGLYKAMLGAIVAHLTECGFQKITSRHQATNNRVIIPKLKRGFVITGFEVTDAFGTCVWLTYYTNEIRRKILDLRCGDADRDGLTSRYFRNI